MKDKLYYPKEINERVKNGVGCGSYIDEGWFDLVRSLDKDITKLAPNYTIDQVKEKFGKLRFYIGEVPEDVFEEIYSLINKTEEMSGETCDVCGNHGKLDCYGGLCMTRCEKHKLK